MKKTFFFLAALMASAVMMAQTPTVSASKVTMKYCKTTYGTVTVKTDDFPVDTNGYSFVKEGTYVKKMDNTRGCDSVITYVIVKKNGRLDGEFSVASGKYIQFSKGNLQFRASNGIIYPNQGYLKHKVATGYCSGEFRFAGSQNVTLGETKPNKKGQDTTCVEWQDFFGRGASGYVTKPSYFSHYNGDMENSNYDWGVFNAITNGGDEPGRWRCLTMDEWKYMMGLTTPCRANAGSKWAYSTVDGVGGIVILPDVWTTPANCTWNAKPSTNTYTSAQWTAMENNGAVFLPTTGYYESSYKSKSNEGYYYTSDGDMFGYWADHGTNNGLVTTSGTSSVFGFVRLVSDVE